MRKHWKLMGAIAAFLAVTVLWGTPTPGGDTATPAFAAADRDGDGIPNSVENKPAYKRKGGSPGHKDIWVECDYMRNLPRSFKFAKVSRYLKDSFAAGPIKNPDGKTGINFHLVKGEAFKYEKQWGGNLFSNDPSVSNAAYNKLYNQAMARRTQSFVNDPDVDETYYHYCIIVNLAETTGGLLGISMDSTNRNGGIPGDTVVLSFGGDLCPSSQPNCPDNQLQASAERQAGTLHHELGHNIGLRHGGNDHANYKLNYLSGMNYFFADGYFKQTGENSAGVAKHWDYSIYKAKTLNEHRLREKGGVDAPPAITRKKLVGIVRCPSGSSFAWYFFVFNKSLDFNCNGKIDATTVGYDINFDGAQTTHGTQNNWANLVWDGGAIGGAGASAPSERAPIVGEPNGHDLADFYAYIAEHGLQRAPGND